jgi:quercetin dioxygenase-like cupin family protein
MTVKYGLASEMPEIANPYGISTRDLASTATAHVMLIIMRPHESVPAHAAPADIFIYILAGTGVFDVAGELRELSAGTFVEVPANTRHGVANASEDELRLIHFRCTCPSQGVTQGE